MVNKWIDIDVGKGTVEVNDSITEGDLNSSGIRVEGFSESWKDKMVNAVFYKGKNSVDVMLELNADKDRFTGIVPPQMLKEDGSFKIVIYAVSDEQVDEPYKDVRPAVWAEVKDGLDSAEVLPMDKDVGAYLTLLIDLQNKGATIDEMIERLGDIEAIKTKLEGVEDGAQKNVQADWSENDESSDRFIRNKPYVDTAFNHESNNAIANSVVSAKFSDFDSAMNSARNDIDSAKEDIGKGEQFTQGLNDALTTHRYNGDENIKHLTDEEKINVGKIPDMEMTIGSNTSDIETMSETLSNIEHGNVNVPYADFANKALADSEGNYITDTYATKAEVGSIINELVFDVEKGEYAYDWVNSDASKTPGIFRLVEITGSDGRLYGVSYLITTYFEVVIGYNQLYITNDPFNPTVQYRTFDSILGEPTKWYRWATYDELIKATVSTPVTDVPSTLAVDTEYNFGEQTGLSLAFPTVADDGDVIYITFTSGATATNLTVDTTNTSDIDLIPEPNTGYEIYARYNGSIWIVKYSEYTVSEVLE